MLLATVVAVCLASHAVASAATVPLPEKIYYDLEDAENLFKEHIIKHKRNYNIEDYNKRLVIYKEYLIMVNELNSRHPNTVFSANFFADLTPEERNGYFGAVQPTSNNGSVPVFPAGFEAPDQLDYRDQGIINPPRDQGGCGACAIFSGIGNIEAQYAKKTGQCMYLSTQQLVDCLPINEFNCIDGTLPDVVFNYLAQDPNGCETEDQYPYQGSVQSCHQAKGVVTVTGGRRLSIYDEETLKSSLVQYGPLSVTIQGGALHSYTVGIFNPGPIYGDVNHAVLLVGYGQDQSGTKFWIIKNSWGLQWGEQGYIRLIRGVDALNMGTRFAAVSSVA